MLLFTCFAVVSIIISIFLFLFLFIIIIIFIFIFIIIFVPLVLYPPLFITNNYLVVVIVITIPTIRIFAHNNIFKQLPLTLHPLLNPLNLLLIPITIQLRPRSAYILHSIYTTHHHIIVNNINSQLLLSIHLHRHPI